MENIEQFNSYFENNNELNEYVNRIGYGSVADLLGDASRDNYGWIYITSEISHLPICQYLNNFVEEQTNPKLKELNKLISKELKQKFNIPNYLPSDEKNFNKEIKNYINELKHKQKWKV